MLNLIRGPLHVGRELVHLSGNVLVALLCKAAKALDLDWIIRTHPSEVVRKQAEALRSKLAVLEEL